MTFKTDAFDELARRRHPLDLLPEEVRRGLKAELNAREISTNEVLYEAGRPTPGLFLLRSGVVELLSPEGDRVSRLQSGDSFGERGLADGAPSPHKAISREAGFVYVMSRETFQRLSRDHDAFARYFAPRPVEAPEPSPEQALASATLSDIMAKNLVTVTPEASIREAARLLGEHSVSCLPVVAPPSGDADGAAARLVGIITTGDITDRVVAAGVSPDAPVSEVMTADPVTLPPDAIGFDALLAFSERRIGHAPIVDSAGRLVGLITTTNFVRGQTVSGLSLLDAIGRRSDFSELAEVTARIPALLEQLIGGGVSAHKTARIITRVADALTRRLCALAEAKLGPPPVPYLWLACGSQGRSEQTGVSDQDNCLILSDDYDAEAHGAYFETFAKFVSDGLDAAGYFYCPGDMMATNPQWRQPLSVWRGYFKGWVDKPDPTAQLLATVMFDLRAIAGDASLFEGLHAETIDYAASNSIFIAHMGANAQTNAPPLSLFGGISVAKSGDHKNTIDLKHAGIAPIVDLGRFYALKGRILRMNTRRRIDEAIDRRAVSETGGRDLLDAYDLIANLRLQHQARLIREGRKPDNFMAPQALSTLERSHLRDAFTVIKTLQSAAGGAAGALS